MSLVAERLPQRFYREHRWRVLGTAMIVRMADTVESLMALMSRGYAVDGSILLRALYEQVVMYCWISIDRDKHLVQWNSNANWHLRQLHRDAVSFGESVMSADELKATARARKLEPLKNLAAEVDEHWGSRLIGFRPPQSDPGDILTFRGLYVAIYRISSRAAHVQPESLEPYGDFTIYPRVVRRPETEESIWWPIAVPLYAQALLVCNEQLGWPDPDRVRKINNAMYA